MTCLKGKIIKTKWGDTCNSSTWFFERQIAFLLDVPEEVSTIRLGNRSFLIDVPESRAVGTGRGCRLSPRPLPPLCVEVGFYADISWESRWDIEINVWAQFCKIFSTLLTLNKRDAWKKLKLPKVGKDCLKLSSFLWFTHWWNRSFETEWLL